MFFFYECSYDGFLFLKISLGKVQAHKFDAEKYNKYFLLLLFYFSTFYYFFLNFIHIFGSLFLGNNQKLII